MNGASSTAAGINDEAGVRAVAADTAPRRERRSGLLDLLVLGALVLLLYLPVIHAHYAMQDDYSLPYLWKFEFRSMAFQQGRPLTVALLYLTAPLFSVGSAGLLRLLSLAGLTALAIACAGALRRLGLSGWQARLGAVLIICLPPCTLYAGWLVCWPYPWAAAAAVVAAVLALSRPAAAGWVTWRDLLALTLMLLALPMYQPAAMMYWAFVGGAVLLGKLPARRNWFYAAGVGLIGMAVYFVAFRLVVRLGLFPDAERCGLATSLLAKLAWVYHEVLPNVLNLWNIVPRRTVTSVVAGVALLGIGAVVLRVGRLHGFRRAALVTLGFGACALLSYAPNVAVRDNWAAYRTLVAPMTLVCLALMSATIAFTQSLPARAWLRNALLGALAVLAMGVARSTLTTGLVRPLEQEFAFVQQLACSGLRPGVTGVVVTPPMYSDSPAAVQRYDEFGVPASRAWNAPCVVHDALQDAGLDADAFQISVTEPDAPEPANLAADVLWLDLRTLRNFRSK